MAFEIMGFSILVIVLFLADNKANGQITGMLNCSSMEDLDSTSSSPHLRQESLNMTVSFLASLSGYSIGKRIAASFFLAIDKLNKMAHDKGLNLTFNTGLSNIEPDEVKIVKTMVDHYCHGMNTVFVGPDTLCKMAAIQATALKMPLISFVSYIYC